MVLSPWNRSLEQTPADPIKSRRSPLTRRVLYPLLYFTILIFLILVEIGNVSNRVVLRDIYFLKIDLSEIIPRSVPDALLINSIARSIGLHDFYQVGLWSFCEGYEDGTGITACSKPKTLYFFNPVEILLNELLAGATIALPAGVTRALEIARVASHWMFGLFLMASVLAFFCIFVTPFSLSPNTPMPSSPTGKNTHIGKKRYLFPLTILTFATFLTTIAASVLATAMFTIFKIVFEKNQADLNIHANLGVRMLAFMWIATGLSAIGFIFHSASLCACCCCCCCITGRKQYVGPDGDERREKNFFDRRRGNMSSSNDISSGGERVGDTRRRPHGWSRIRIVT